MTLNTMTRNTWLYLLALLLPVTFLGVESLHHVWARAHAQTYDVVLKGYDPRDLVYGEYMQFRIEWADPASQKPADRDVKDLPETARMYLPEGQGYDLQDMLRDEHHRFTANALLMGKRASLQDLKIDGSPWQDALKTWRERRAQQTRQ